MVLLLSIASPGFPNVIVLEPSQQPLRSVVNRAYPRPRDGAGRDIEASQTE
jgi:hypothetical protein